MNNINNIFAWDDYDIADDETVVQDNYDFKWIRNIVYKKIEKWKRERKTKQLFLNDITFEEWLELSEELIPFTIQYRKSNGNIELCYIPWNATLFILKCIDKNFMWECQVDNQSVMVNNVATAGLATVKIKLHFMIDKQYISTPFLGNQPVAIKYEASRFGKSTTPTIYNSFDINVAVRRALVKVVAEYFGLFANIYFEPNRYNKEWVKENKKKLAAINTHEITVETPVDLEIKKIEIPVKKTAKKTADVKETKKENVEVVDFNFDDNLVSETEEVKEVKPTEPTSAKFKQIVDEWKQNPNVDATKKDVFLKSIFSIAKKSYGWKNDMNFYEWLDTLNSEKSEDLITQVKLLTKF